jgi:hypothetical protein
MNIAMVRAFVIAGTCLFATGSASAESATGEGSAGTGSAGSSMSGMTSQGLASEPAGIGERGTGQMQSTLERSGVPAQKGMSSGQTPNGQSQSASGGSSSEMPSGIGEQGTGQTQSTAERSGGQGGADSQTSSSQSQSAMERPEK